MSKPLSPSSPPPWAKVSEREIGAWRAFLAFLEVYPRRQKVQQAWATWRKHQLGAITGPDLVRSIMADPRLRTDDVRFIPLPSSIINDHIADDAEVLPDERLPFEAETITDREEKIRKRTLEIMESEFLGHPSARRKAMKEVDGG